MIRKEGKKWVLYSKDGKKKLGIFGSEKEASEREQEINYFEHAKAEVTLTITKASLQPDGTMRWQAIVSDTDMDITGEHTSQALFQNWIRRVETGKGVSFLPPPRKPFLGVSHYSALNGYGEAGTTEKMYIDGNTFKVSGTFHNDNPVGKAVFETIRREIELVQRGQTVAQPVRISAAWWDLAHSHGDFIFERKSLDDTCPMCASGAKNKEYLDGQPDHWATTRVPINPRTSIELEVKAMVKRVEDAATIIGSELAEELEQRSRLVGKSETEEEPPEGLVIKAEDEMEEYRPFGGATTMGEAKQWLQGQEMMRQAYSNWGMFRELMDNVMAMDDPGEMKSKMMALVGEFGNELAALKAAVEDAYLVLPAVEILQGGQSEMNDKFDTAVAALSAAVTGDGTREARIEAANKAFSQLGEVVKAEIDAAVPPSPDEQISEAFAPVVEKLDLLLAKLGSQPATPVQVPQQKSFAPSGPVNPQPGQPVSPVTGQPSKLTAMIRRSVGIQ